MADGPGGGILLVRNTDSRVKNRLSDKLFWSQINEFSQSTVARMDKLSKVVHGEIVIYYREFYIALCKGNLSGARVYVTGNWKVS